MATRSITENGTYVLDNNARGEQFIGVAGIFGAATVSVGYMATLDTSETFIPYTDLANQTAGFQNVVAVGYGNKVAVQVANADSSTSLLVTNGVIWSE